MAGKKRHFERENHERWLVSYADFITLLFAFFVVMFATSQTDKGKAKQMSEAVKNAIENGQVPPMIHALLGGAKGERGVGNAQRRGPGGSQKGGDHRDPSSSPELLATASELRKQLKTEIDAGKIEVQLEPRGLVVSLREAAFFPSGSAVLVPQGLESIAKLAAAIGKLPNPLRLEGHTDSVPIRNSNFRNNWELSAARSIAMLELLHDKHGVDYNRMAVAGYAETMPVESNDTEGGRQHNRRVDVVIMAPSAMSREPAPAGTAPLASAGGRSDAANIIERIAEAAR